MLFNTEQPLDFGTSLEILNNRNRGQTLSVIGAQARPSDNSPNPVSGVRSLTVPAHVQQVQAIATKTSDVSSKVTVSFKRGPQDYQFVSARCYVVGYKGNPQPVQMAEGQAPLSFQLENTGEPVAILVQSSGDLGQAPLSTAPSTTLQLVKTPLATVPTTAGNGPGTLEVQTNGVDNASQILLNLKSSDSSLQLTNSGGDVDIIENPFGKSSPMWWSSGDGTIYPFTTGLGDFSTGTANQIKFWMFRLPICLTVSKLATYINTLVNPSVCGFGVYSFSGGTKYFSWDSIATNTSGAKGTTLGAPVTLAPGVYIFACGCSVTGRPLTQGGYSTEGTNEPVQPWNANVVRTGTAANALSSGAMPSTLGALSTSNAISTVLPCIIMEP
jgi:hypothetical protein